MPDIRGHGNSFTVQLDFSLETASEDIIKIIRHLNLDTPIILGHSMGGQIATLIAANQPELVSKIILEDPAYILKEKSMKIQLIRTVFKYMIKRGMKKNEEQLRKLGRRLNRSWEEEDVNTWATGQKEFGLNNPLTVFENLSVNVDWHNIFPKVFAPTLLIVPSKGFLRLKEAEEIVSEFKNAEIAFIKNAGHSVRRDNFKAFMEAVKSFLNT